MRIDIISAVPDLLQSPLNHSIVKRAQDKGLVEIVVHNLHEYGFGQYRQIDDTPFGGGAGMVLMIEPIAACIRQLQAERTYDEIIYTAPDGKTFNQQTANALSLKKNIIILCGHYKGVDERVREMFVTQEISIGDYVLSGGELAAAIITDAVVRVLPNVLSDETSALSDSFQDNLLAPPVYTRPAEFEGLSVPDVLLSGNHAKIAQWRDEQSITRTQERRPDLLDLGFGA
ncbi:MAG: tRNA (guanosine(37)-N1)-methyltransferase TrmD [Bacteroidetes bacterium]|nr:MAG: tRNA (guanosine(37)-N1)-methyltransferase TrmD [Bacteroidota bacterium]